MMSAVVHRQIQLNAYPDSMPKATDFRLVEGPLPAAGAGEMLIRTLYLGLEPRLRLMMNPTTDDNRAMRPHGAMTDIGRVMPGTLLGEVIESNSAKCRVGQIVEGFLGWQNYVVTDGAPHPSNNPEGVAICDTSLADAIEFIGPLGAPGLTAWLALKHEGKLQPGETMVITSAAGMVGCLAGQLGKLAGARVIGLTSADEKVRYLTDDLGFDAGINYRNSEDLATAIRDSCPDGVDYYFDNTGGAMAETIKAQLTGGGQVTRCGLIAHYNAAEQWGQSKGFAGQFSVHEHVPEYPDARRAMGKLLAAGAIQYQRRVFTGLEQTPEALNIGKWIVDVSAD